MDEDSDEGSDVTWTQVLPLPKGNGWTLSVITALLRMAAETDAFVTVTLGTNCPMWFRMMHKVIFWTRVHFPLKVCERSMPSYAKYISFMLTCTKHPDTQEPCSSEHRYCMMIAVIIMCEWMRNSGKVNAILTPFPYNLKVLQDNLWREFGSPPQHMNVPVSSTKNVDTMRLRAPHLLMVAREIFEYLEGRNRSSERRMNFEDLNYCLRLTTAAKLLFNHCYVVLHHLALVPSMRIPTARLSQGSNTRQFCKQTPAAPKSLPRDVKRLLTMHDIHIDVIHGSPYSSLDALIAAQCETANRLIWVCQHLILLHNSELDVNSPKWSHPRVHS